jgi:hypothetical protein
VINSLSKTALTKALGSLGLVVLLALSYVLLLSPRMGRAAEINEQTQGVEATNVTLQRQVKALQAKAAKLPEEIESAKPLAAAFPATADLDVLFKQIQDAGRAAGLKTGAVSSTTQGVPVIVANPLAGATAGTGAVGLTGGGGNVKLASMPFSVNAAGNSASLVRFLEELETMPRAYLIQTAIVSGDGTSGSVSLALTGSMFVMSQTAPPTIDPKTGQVLPPAAAPKPAPAAQ